MRINGIEADGSRIRRSASFREYRHVMSEETNYIAMRPCLAPSRIAYATDKASHNLMGTIAAQIQQALQFGNLLRGY